MHAALQAVSEDPGVLEVRGHAPTVTFQFVRTPSGLLQLGLERSHLLAHTHTHAHTHRLCMYLQMFNLSAAFRCTPQRPASPWHRAVADFVARFPVFPRSA